MTTETRKLRVGLDSPLVADHWSRSASAILDVNEADISRESDRRWRWRLADVEEGTVEFMDSTPGNTELRLELEREDGEAAARIERIVDRFAALLSGEGGFDPPVVARDPHLGEPLDAPTDPDQPL